MARPVTAGTSVLVCCSTATNQVCPAHHQNASSTSHGKYRTGHRAAWPLPSQRSLEPTQSSNEVCGGEGGRGGGTWGRKKMEGGGGGWRRFQCPCSVGVASLRRQKQQEGKIPSIPTPPPPHLPDLHTPLPSPPISLDLEIS